MTIIGFFFFFQAEDGIRDKLVTGVQTCALPIFLENNGDSWTLAEPRVSCKSGGDAKFVVGGEIPIPVVSGLGQTSVIYKQYGVILEFHPVADDQGNVSSKIVAEVSQPDQQFTNQG